MPISEGGRSLSGGQKQAIGLARVLIRRPKILFLDEPTAHFDVRSESEFLERLKVLADGKMTIIVSTHRLSLLSLVDRLLLFDKGRLVADGPRDKVIALLQGNANKPSPAASQGTPSPGAAPSSAAAVVATISSSAASATAAARAPTGTKSSVAI
jgi:ATP-binding cassette subfamily C protein LapB